jgi:exopolysaccharide biosynthesis polyprenyl glycosylphosphotransferase
VSASPTAPALPPRRRFENRFVALLILADLLVCVTALLAAYALRAGLLHLWLPPLGHSLQHYLPAVPLIAALWLVVFAALGMYEPRRTLSPIAARAADFRAVSLAVLMIAAAAFLSHRSFSRAVLLEFWLLALPLTWIVRAELGKYRRDALASGKAVSRVLLVGCGDLAQVVLQRLRRVPFGLQPVGYVDLGEGAGELADLPRLGTIADLPAVLAQQRIDEVLVADPDVPPGELMEAIRQSEQLSVSFMLLAGPLQVLTRGAELSGPGDLPIIELHSRRFGPLQRAVKRVCDLLAASLLLLGLAPLMLIITALIRRQTGEPALFLQTRVGYHGKPFTLIKFRTMRSDTAAYALSPSHPDDERVTPIGRWLRRSSLDELPQLWNIIKGEMSLVGPRPEMPFIVEQYEPWQRRRLEAMPGLTGLWQILGRKDLPLRENIEYDFYYIRNQSLLLDLAILLRTLPLVLLGRGAY